MSTKEIIERAKKEASKHQHKATKSVIVLMPREQAFIYDSAATHKGISYAAFKDSINVYATESKQSLHEFAVVSEKEEVETEVGEEVEGEGKKAKRPKY